MSIGVFFKNCWPGFDAAVKALARNQAADAYDQALTFNLPVLEEMYIGWARLETCGVDGVFNEMDALWGQSKAKQGIFGKTADGDDGIRALQVL